MSDSESDGSDVLKEWTVVNELGDFESDDSFEKVDNLNENSNTDGTSAALQMTSDLSTVVVPQESMETNELLAGANEDAHHDSLDHHSEVDSLSSGSSIELLEMCDDCVDQECSDQTPEELASAAILRTDSLSAAEVEMSHDAESTTFNDIINGSEERHQCVDVNTAGLLQTENTIPAADLETSADITEIRSDARLVPVTVDYSEYDTADTSLPTETLDESLSANLEKTSGDHLAVNLVCCNEMPLIISPEQVDTLDNVHDEQDIVVESAVAEIVFPQFSALEEQNNLSSVIMDEVTEDRGTDQRDIISEDADAVTRMALSLSANMDNAAGGELVSENEHDETPAVSGQRDESPDTVEEKPGQNVGVSATSPAEDIVHNVAGARPVQHNSASLAGHGRGTFGSPLSHLHDDDDADEIVAATEDMANECVDDRCESDISGVVTDDTDLSSVSGMGDLALASGDVVRTYRHQPNPSINSQLTCIAVFALLFAFAIGLGHFVGSTRMSSLHKQHLNRMHSMQDEYYVCLNHETQLEQAIAEADQKVATVAGAWQLRYEELERERTSLLLQLNQSAEELDQLNVDIYLKDRRLHELEVIEKKYDRYIVNMIQDVKDNKRMESELAEKDSLITQMTKETDELRNTVNRLRTENLDLASQIRNLRYSKPPGNGDVGSKVELDAMKNTANQLRIENDDLRSYVRGLRYAAYQRGVSDGSALYGQKVEKSHTEDNADDAHVVKSKQTEFDTRGDSRSNSEQPASTGPSAPDDVAAAAAAADLSLELLRLRRLFDAVGIEWQNGEQMHADVPDSQVPIFITLLKHLLPLAGNSTATTRDVIRQTADCIEVLKNATVGQRLVDVMTSSWDHVVAGLSKNKNAKYEAGLTACRRDFGTDSMRPNAGGKNSTKMEDVFRQYMNRTFETVAKLSSAIQTTLDRMRTIPDELFAENKTAKKIAQKLTSVVTKLESQVRGGWNTFSDNFKSVSKKWFGNDKSTSKSAKGSTKRRQDRQKRKADGRKSSMKQDEIKEKKKESRFSFDSKRIKTVLKPIQDKFNQWFGSPKSTKTQQPETFEQQSGHDSHDNRRQTESNNQPKPAGQQKLSIQEPQGPTIHEYEDFWGDDKYDPDDYLPEGFFEGNHREWRRQHERRFRSVYGHMQRLNEEMFLSMDEDDVDDLHDMVEDFADDAEDRDEPVRFRNWISCQVRWWKSRLHRKHRDEDLAIGCGQQLVHWQLRVICKDDGDRGGRLTKICQTAMSPPEKTTTASPETTPSPESYPSRSDEQKGETGRDDDSPIINTRLVDGDEQPHVDDHEVPKTPCIDENENNITRSESEGSDWYFRLAQHREDSHQTKPDWYFDMMDERKKERAYTRWLFNLYPLTKEQEQLYARGEFDPRLDFVDDDDN